MVCWLRFLYVTTVCTIYSTTPIHISTAIFVPQFHFRVYEKIENISDKSQIII